MKIGRARLGTRVQIGLGAGVLALSLHLCVAHVPRLRLLLRSLDGMAAGGQQQLSMTSELLKNTQVILTDVEKSIGGCEAAVHEVRWATGEMAGNLEDWSARSRELARVCKNASDVCKAAARKLPVRLPSGIGPTYKKVDLRVTSFNVPVGIKVSYRTMMTREKKTLKEAGKTFATAERALSRTSKRMKESSDALDSQVVPSLTEAQESLGRSKRAIGDLRARRLPQFTAELGEQRAEIDRARASLSALEHAIFPLAAVLILLPLALIVNGLLLSSVLRRLAEEGETPVRQTEDETEA